MPQYVWFVNIINFIKFFMKKRITIVLQDEIYKKLIQKQSNMIKSQAAHVSFSQTVSEILKTGLKK